MNGNIPAFDPAQFIDPNLLRLAESILDGVKSGKISALGAVFVGPNGIQTQTVGAPFPLYFGADMMKANLYAAVMTPQKAPILRPVA